MDAQAQTRSCDRNRDKVGKLTSKGCRQICIPMTREQYDDTWNDLASVREYLKPLICDYPEMFPATVADGNQLRGYWPESKKLPGVRLGQIRTHDGVYTLRPSFVFSCMTGTSSARSLPSGKPPPLRSLKQHRAQTPRPRTPAQRPRLPPKLAPQPPGIRLTSRLPLPHIESGRVSKF